MWTYKGQIQYFQHIQDNGLVTIKYTKCNKEHDQFHYSMECWSTDICNLGSVLETIGDFRKANNLNEIHLFKNKEKYGIAMAPRTHGMATYFFDGEVDTNTHYLPYFIMKPPSDIKQPYELITVKDIALGDIIISNHKKFYITDIFTPVGIGRLDGIPLVGIEGIYISGKHKSFYLAENDPIIRCRNSQREKCDN